MNQKKKQQWQLEEEWEGGGGGEAGVQAAGTTGKQEIKQGLHLRQEREASETPTAQKKGDLETSDRQTERQRDKRGQPAQKASSSFRPLPCPLSHTHSPSSLSLSTHCPV